MRAAADPDPTLRVQDADATAPPAKPVNDLPLQIPNTRTLLAFEAAARLSSVTRAADERHTSQSAVSRHIRALEESLGVVLFQRAGRGIELTKDGQEYFLAVRTSIDALDGAARQLRRQRPTLSMGCTPEISVLVMLPIFSRLRRALGDGVALRTVVYDHDVLPLLDLTGLDIVFESSSGQRPKYGVELTREEVVPVASPAFQDRFGSLLACDPARWTTIPRLDSGRRSPGRATWDTWFRANGCAPPGAPVESFENYIHLLRAAADGDGIALGWNGFMSDYFESGRLVALCGAWLSTELIMYAVPTRDAAHNRVLNTCLIQLASLISELCTDVPAASRPA